MAKCRDDFDVDARFANPVEKIKIGANIEKVLRYRRGCTRVQLALQIVQTSAGLAACGMRFACRNADLEIGYVLEDLLTKSAASRTPGVRTVGLVVRRVAAKRDDMTYPRSQPSLSDCVDFLPGSSDAGQVRRRRQ